MLSIDVYSHSMNVTIYYLIDFLRRKFTAIQKHRSSSNSMEKNKQMKFRFLTSYSKECMIQVSNTQ
jgi:hypothetical protein